MSFFPSLGENSAVRDVMRLNPEASRLLIAFHEVVLRGPSPLSVEQREMLAAFVSGLNSCTYCHGVHAATAKAFGVDQHLLASLVSDPECRAAERQMRPLLRFVRKLTLTPAKMVEGDAQEVFDAGWDERALHDAVSTAALFNFMNRYVEGHGLQLDAAELAARGAGLAREGYSPLAASLPESSNDPSPK